MVVHNSAKLTKNKNRLVASKILDANTEIKIRLYPGKYFFELLN